MAGTEFSDAAHNPKACITTATIGVMEKRR